uniref:Calbindin n=1 Tax=Salmo trutta TaxID=8032 RepID=A0A674DB51_SALTR
MANAYLQGVEISASQFLDIFHHYDNDGNGYIEGKELQSFIKELQQARKQAGLELTDQMKAFVQEYEKNTDAKIGIVELVQILPTEENFLLFFRQQLKSCAEFIRVYTYHSKNIVYTASLSNNFENSVAKWLQQIAPYSIVLHFLFCRDLIRLFFFLFQLKIFDSNHDGKLCLAEMARLLPDEENFLLKFQNVKMVRREFNKIFELYDQDENGYMDENELDALLKDLCEKNKKVLEVNKIPTYKTAIMALSDGGKLYRTELALVLCAEDISDPAPL